MIDLSNDLFLEYLFPKKNPANISKGIRIGIITAKAAFMSGDAIETSVPNDVATCTVITKIANMLINTDPSL